MTITLNRAKYAVICEPLEGQLECGDQYLVKEVADGILFAVVDGLGHGEEAAYAAKQATETIDKYAEEPIETLFKRCDEALHSTRGAAITMVKLNEKYSLNYLSIGNVLGVCWNVDKNGMLTRQSLYSVGGIVGSRLPQFIQTKEISVSPSDTLILATDGIKPAFEVEPARYDTPDKISQQIFDNYRNTKDDGLVLVALFL